MIEKGYREDFATGVVAAGGTLGIMIPPSITFVTYGIITENSIAKLLIAGILPGLFISLLLCIFIFIRVRLNPSLVKEVFMDDTKLENSKVNGHSGGLKRDLLLLAPPLLCIGTWSPLYRDINSHGSCRSGSCWSINFSCITEKVDNKRF